LAGVLNKAEQDNLPSYEKPPVVEVVCGVLFEPLEGFTIPHMGLWWQALQPGFPYIEEHGPLPALIEQGLNPPPQMPTVQLLQTPPMPRVWFVSEDQSLILQVQKDRFLSNWKKVDDQAEYPRYGKVIGHFKEYLDKFRTFLKAAGLGEIKPLQYELTYVNQLLVGDSWNSPKGIHDIFPDLAWRDNHVFLPNPEAFSFNLSFSMPDECGRLHVAATTGLRQSDNRTVVQLNLTARGMSKDRNIEGAAGWFDVAREWIVKGFTDLISERMQKDVWGRVK
jgi:uncharacterized protein (TIGR04255 family)